MKPGEDGQTQVSTPMNRAGMTRGTITIESGAQPSFVILKRMGKVDAQ